MVVAVLANTPLEEQEEMLVVVVVPDGMAEQEVTNKVVLKIISMALNVVEMA